LIAGANVFQYQSLFIMLLSTAGYFGRFYKEMTSYGGRKTISLV